MFLIAPGAQGLASWESGLSQLKTVRMSQANGNSKRRTV